MSPSTVFVDNLIGAQARIQQLEGELAGVAQQRAQWAESSEANAKRASDAEADRDTLRVEVNRLNAEAFELKRKLEEYVSSGPSQAETRMAAVVESAREVIAWFDSESVVTAAKTSLLFDELRNRFSALDQPNEPKSKEAT